MMKQILFLAMLAACGSKSNTPVANSGSGAAAEEPPGPVTDTRTEIERRRDTAADAIAKRAVTCAVEDAQHAVDAGEITPQQFDEQTKPELRDALYKDWLKKLTVPLSSFQVRVLEVCNRDTKTCDELHDCMQHINDQPK